MSSHACNFPRRTRGTRKPSAEKQLPRCVLMLLFWMPIFVTLCTLWTTCIHIYIYRYTHIYIHTIYNAYTFMLALGPTCGAEFKSFDGTYVRMSRPMHGLRGQVTLVIAWLGFRPEASWHSTVRASHGGNRINYYCASGSKLGVLQYILRDRTKHAGCCDFSTKACLEKHACMRSRISVPRGPLYINLISLQPCK